MRQTDGGVASTNAGMAIEILEQYASGRHGSSNSCRCDSGPIVVAHLARSLSVTSDALPQRVAERWLAELPERIQALGAFGGLGGFLAGLRAGVGIDRDFSRLLNQVVAQTGRWLGEPPWRTAAVAWNDYDLFHGPAGFLLAGASKQSDTSPFVPAARHLARLCATPELDGLRAGTEIDPRSAFNVGRINTGMGHGVTGVAAALRHVIEVFDDGDAYRPTLRRACDWLVEEAFLADDDFITWPPVGRDGAPASGAAPHRQAWCYGTPGVAWTLWDAGRVLGDASLQLLGAEAMRSFCRLFDPERHLEHDDIGETLAVCHGAAGTLAVADAFARHAGLTDASALRDFLYRYLIDRAEQIIDIANSDMTMLNGAGGIASVLLTVQGGARDWLCQLALR